MIKKHMRKSQQNPNGAIIEREGSLHMSSVVKAEVYDSGKGRKTAVAA